MDKRDTAAIVAAIKQQHPDAIESIRALAALKGTPAEAAASGVMAFLLNTFDEKEQTLWQLRDLVSHRDCEDGTRTYFLRYSDGSMVPRICAAAGLDMSKTPHRPTD